MTKNNQINFLFCHFVLLNLLITASVFESCSNDDDPADFSDENIQHGPICGLLIDRFGGFAPSECNYGIISYILVSIL